jgi:hypothetical protein
MAYSWTSARAAALKKAQEASARLRRGKAQVKNRVKAVVKSAKRSVAAGVASAKAMRASGAGVGKSAKVGLARAKFTARTRKNRIAMANKRRGDKK